MTTAKPTKRASRKAEQRAEMIEQILDVAEALFSKHGLYGVTLADVAQQVGVHRTLLSYYFRDKKELFDQVFARRAVVTSETRMRALEEYERAAGDSPTVEGVLQAFLDTDLDLYIQGGEGWRNYAALGAQVANTPEWGAEMMDDYFDPVVLRHNHHRASVVQRPRDISHEHVEREACELQQPHRELIQPVFPLVARRRVHQTAVLDHHALRLARRSRRIDHVRQILRMGFMEAAHADNNIRMTYIIVVHSTRQFARDHTGELVGDCVGNHT